MSDHKLRSFRASIDISHKVFMCTPYGESRGEGVTNELPKR